MHGRAVFPPLSRGPKNSRPSPTPSCSRDYPDLTIRDVWTAQHNESSTNQKLTDAQGESAEKWERAQRVPQVALQPYRLEPDQIR